MEKRTNRERNVYEINSSWDSWIPSVSNSPFKLPHKWNGTFMLITRWKLYVLLIFRILKYKVTTLQKASASGDESQLNRIQRALKKYVNDLRNKILRQILVISRMLKSVRDPNIYDQLLRVYEHWGEE